MSTSTDHGRSGATARRSPAVRPMTSSASLSSVSVTICALNLTTTFATIHSYTLHNKYSAICWNLSFQFQILTCRGLIYFSAWIRSHELRWLFTVNTQNLWNCLLKSYKFFWQLFLSDDIFLLFKLFEFRINNLHYQGWEEAGKTFTVWPL